MSRRKDLGGATVSAEQLKQAVIEQAGSGFLGMLSLVGQTGVKVQTEGGSYPLPDADYIVLMLAKPTGAKRVGWVRVEEADGE